MTTVGANLEHLHMSGGPQIRSETDINRIMWTVVLAMLPVTAWSFWAFGMRAVAVVFFSVIFALVFEYVFLRMRYSHSQCVVRVLDGSAVVSGILLALNLGPGSPWWLILAGALVAMGIGKHAYGGLGANPFNPVLVARVFLLLSFPVQMTTWFSVDAIEKAKDPLLKLDGLTSATPLGALKEGGWDSFIEAFQQTDLWNYLLFNKGGCLGDVSVLMLLLGALIMLFRGVISWHIPISYLAGLSAVTGAAWLYDPSQYANPVFHLVTGSLILGAFYMATDMVTTPISEKGHVVFGIGCGVITAVIRLWGGYPEGVSFAILIMNGLVPLIDRWTKPRLLGEQRKEEEKKS